MELKFKSTNPKVVQSDIARFEKRIGFELPEDYKEFILKQNGGEVELEYEMYFKNETASIVLDSFHGIEPEGVDLYGNGLPYYMMREPDWIPKHLLEIGVCYDGHNRIVMSLSPENYGHVYIWDNETNFSYDEDLPVAKSFREFLDKVSEIDHERALREYYKMKRSSE